VGKGASVSVGGGAAQPVSSFAGAFFAMSLPAGATSLTFDTAPEVRLSRAYNGSIVVSRGALIYSLSLGENATVAGVPFKDFPQGPNYHVLPTLPWNYALVVADVSDPGASFNFTRHGPPGAQPFSGTDVPVSMTAWARRVGAWGEYRNGAAPPPASPVCAAPADQCGDLELVTLLPHGSTLLRMTALPYAER
jgi:hypothetical protein